MSLAIDLVGFETVASDILAGVTEEISNTFEESTTNNWGVYSAFS